jgi:large subunit ribosomal protein L13
MKTIAQKKTYLAKPADEANREWFVIDASDLVLGRLASKLARVLTGKHKPTYTPHVDMGDFVVVTNVDKLRTTGGKARTKAYRHWTGYPGGLRTDTYSELMERDPGRVLTLAVQRMLPRTKLGRWMLRKLKPYRGTEHPHAAQQPKPLDIEKV